MASEKGYRLFGMLQAYCQTVTISNPSRATVEATLRAGSSDRWTVSPTKLVLKPQQSIDVDVRLRVLRFAQKQKAIKQGQRDIFHIKVTSVDRKQHWLQHMIQSKHIFVSSAHSLKQAC